MEGVISSDRRSTARSPLRTQVRYWIAGESRSHLAFSKDISRTGVFIQTASLAQVGASIRMEIQNGERTKSVNGVVAALPGRSWSEEIEPARDGNPLPRPRRGGFRDQGKGSAAPLTILLLPAAL